jgi:hypothetical protein
MRILGAVLREQGQTFAVVVVQRERTGRIDAQGPYSVCRQQSQGI